MLPALSCYHLTVPGILRADCLCGSVASGAAQVELVVEDMRRSLTRRAGVDRRLPQFVGMTGFQDYAINLVVLVSLA